MLAAGYTNMFGEREEEEKEEEEEEEKGAGLSHDCHSSLVHLYKKWKRRK